MKKKIHIILTGGTIACKPTPNGSYEILDLSDFLDGFEEIHRIAEVKCVNLLSLAGKEMRISDTVLIAEECKRAIREDGAEGIVVIVGTNIMEEVSYAMNVLVHTEVPIVFTGSMRVPTAPSPDGPNNVISAIQTAASPNSRGMGTLVVMNEKIFSAEYVRKEHSMNLDAFSSEFLLGYVSEGKASYRCRPVLRPLPDIEMEGPEKKVMLYTSYLGDTGSALEVVNQLGYEAVVVEGTGGGGLPSWVVDKMIDLVKTGIPVVLSARVGHGDTIVDTYGSAYCNGRWCKENGIILSGLLDSRKARMLVTYLLMAGYSTDQIRNVFEVYSLDYVLQDEKGGGAEE